MSPSTLTRIARLLAAEIAVPLIPATVLACPFCYAASNPRTLHAFYVSTAVLTLMPLMLVGGFAIWISRAYRNPGVRRGQPTTATRSSVER
jgi:hypothetical protein